MVYKDFDKFMSAKPEYNKEDLLKQVLKKYYLFIEMFIKINTNIVTKHQEK